MAKASLKKKSAGTSKVKKAKSPTKTAAKAPAKTKVKAVASAKVEAKAKVALKKEMKKKPEVKAEKALTAKVAETAKPEPPVEVATPAAEVAAPVQDSTPAELKSLYKKISQAGNNWENVYKLASRVLKAKNYKMSEVFEARTPIQHKVLGWGYVLSSENNRIQVLFKDGVKTLITSYNK